MSDATEDKQGATSLEQREGFRQEFDEQKQAFKRIPSEELEPYKGQFVVSRDGQIVDHDQDLSALTNRSFAGFGHVPVYIARIGEPVRITLRTTLRTHV